MQVNKIIKVPRFIARRIASGAIIKRYDRVTDSAHPYTGGDLAEGYLMARIDDLMGVPGFSDRLAASDLRVTPTPEKRAFFTWDIPAFVWQALLQSQRLNDMVSAYLGPAARLDDLYVKTVTDGYDSTSEGWHTDHVGYRLKVFMVFDVAGDPAGTVVVPRHRPNLYTLQLGDEIARALHTPKMDTRAEALRVTYTAGDCLVFDTNLPHRGDYSTGHGTRYCLMAEYIDRAKADALLGRAPCGPGQGRRDIVIPPLQGVDLAGHPMIDQRLLRPGADGGHVYGYGRG